MTEFITFIKGCFLLPGYIVFFIFDNLNSIISGKEISKIPKALPESMIIFSVFFWIILGGWLFYENQYNKVTYVFACPNNNTSKCYNVRADYNPGSCDDGHCDASTFSKIYFDNGGYISFDWCRDSNGKTTCFAEDSNDGSWDIKVDRVIRVKK